MFQKTGKTLGLAAASLWAAFAMPALAQQDQAPAIADEQAEFDFLLGTWKTRVDFFDRDGNVRRTDLFGQRVEPTVQGVFYRGISGPENLDPQFGETWFIYDQTDERHKIVTADAQGNFDIFEGIVLEDRMVFTTPAKPWQGGDDIMWRRTYYNIEEDRHEVLMEYSFDYGYTWTEANHWTRTRPGA